MLRSDIYENNTEFTSTSFGSYKPPVIALQNRDLPIISDPENNDIAPTAVVHYAKDKSTRLLKDNRFPLGVRPYSVREFARLQGVPDWFKFPVSNTAAYRQIGNGVSVPVGRWIGNELKRYFKGK